MRTAGPSANRDSILDSRTAVLILNWNRLDDTAACVASCPAGAPKFILNNGCRPEERYQQLVGAHETVIDSPSNLGFAGGINLLAAHAISQDFRWLLLLNNDARPWTGAIEEMLSLIGEGVSAICPMIIDARSKRVWSIGGRIQLWLGRTTAEFHGRRPDAVDTTSRVVDMGSAACLLISAVAVATVGGLDTTYFAYWEETDWCARANRMGFRVITAPRARVWHRGGASSNPAFRTHLLIRNCILFMRRHAAGYHWMTFIPVLFVWSIPAWSARALIGDPFGTTRSVLRALSWLARWQIPDAQTTLPAVKTAL